MERIDSEMAAVLKRIADARRRRAVLLGFAQVGARQHCSAPPHTAYRVSMLKLVHALAQCH